MEKRGKELTRRVRGPWRRRRMAMEKVGAEGRRREKVVVRR